MGRLLSRAAQMWLGQRGHLFPWVPVAMACGIGLYFTLLVEPSPGALAVAGASGGALVFLQARMGPVLQPFFTALAFVAIGFALAGVRTNLQAAPVLKARYYGPVTGRIVAMDRSASNALRLTLDRVALSRVDGPDTPDTVRISLHGPEPDVKAGQTIQTTGHLAPPAGPVEPGGFDFRRHAWFQSLGAVGYTRKPVVLLAEPEGVWLARLRQALSVRIRVVLPDQTGAFAAAVITGDRTALSPQTTEALRRTNIAHLLAISGLHMGLLAGSVFAAVRITGVALLSDRWPVKKVAAFFALLAALGYLGLSGGNIATQRAFVMAAVALVAVLLDRRALSFRALALAAIIVLALTPEALTGPGFQMSFAATAALVAVFSRVPMRGARGAVMATVLSSVVAGAATAPFAMAHFNQASAYGLIANLATVPLMGVLVMPAGLVAVLLMPLGFEAVPLRVMGAGLDWILSVAARISGWPEAVRLVPAPPDAVLPVLALGGLIVLLWQGRGRWAGMVPVVAAAVLWWQADRPAILVSESARLIGVLTAEGRALSRAKGDGFVARVWLENDGAPRDQSQAASIWPDGGRDLPKMYEMKKNVRVFHIKNQKEYRNFDSCLPQDIVISAADFGHSLPCVLIGPDEVAQSGAHAARLSGGGMIWTTAQQKTGARPWSNAR